MEQLDLVSVVILVAGVLIGGLIVALVTRKKTGASAQHGSYTDNTQWLLRKQDLSSSQRQILEFIESKPKTTIQEVQDQFTRVPDRELFYRLEQLHLVGFLEKHRDGEEVVYSLSKAYAAAVPPDDRTVLIPRQ